VDDVSKVLESVMPRVKSSQLQRISKLDRFLGEAPLVGDETQKQYDAFRAEILSTLTEPNVINELYLKDVVDLSWQICRERRIHADVVLIYQQQVVRRLLKVSHSNPEKPYDEQNNVYRILGAGPDAQLWLADSAARKRIDAELERRGYSPRKVLALAYLEGRIEIDAIEHRIAFYEARRMATLKEIERRNEAAAEQLKRASTRVIEGEFKQAAE
jgi:hypothetical protein